MVSGNLPRAGKKSVPGAIDDLDQVDELSEKLDEYVNAIQQMREAVFEHDVS